MSAPSFATLIGLTGAALGACWPLMRTRSGMLALQLASGCCFIVHFALIEAATASAINVLAALQAAAAIPLGHRPGFRLVYLATAPPIAVAVLATWQGFSSVFAGLAAVMISIGRYQLNVTAFRRLMLVGMSCWLAHDVLVWSVPGMLSDLFAIASSIWMLVGKGARRLPDAPSGGPPHCSRTGPSRR
jgi:hypothetical protein